MHSNEPTLVDDNGMMMAFPSLHGLTGLFEQKYSQAKADHNQSSPDRLVVNLSDYLSAKVFPLPPPDEPILCHVTLAKSPGNFHIRPAEWEEFVLGKLADALDEVYVGDEEDNPECSTATVARLPADQLRPLANCVVQHPGDGAFYRGLIGNAGFEGYRVELVDFGDFVFVDEDQLYQSVEPFASFPYMSYGCSLKDADDTLLTGEHLSTFVQSIEDLNYELMVTFCGTKTVGGRKHEVLLHYPETGASLGLEYIPEKPKKKKRRKRKPKSQRRVFEKAESSDEDEEEDVGDPRFSMQREYERMFADMQLPPDVPTTAGCEDVDEGDRIEELEDDSGVGLGLETDNVGGLTDTKTNSTSYATLIPIAQTWEWLKTVAQIPVTTFRWMMWVYEDDPVWEGR